VRPRSDRNAPEGPRETRRSDPRRQRSRERPAGVTEGARGHEEVRLRRGNPRPTPVSSHLVPVCGDNCELIGVACHGSVTSRALGDPLMAFVSPAPALRDSPPASCAPSDPSPRSAPGALQAHRPSPARGYPRQSRRRTSPAAPLADPPPAAKILAPPRCSNSRRAALGLTFIRSGAAGTAREGRQAPWRLRRAHAPAARGRGPRRARLLRTSPG
jgi:hypothetical protein